MSARSRTLQIPFAIVLFACVIHVHVPNRPSEWAEIDPDGRHWWTLEIQDTQHHYAEVTSIPPLNLDWEYRAIRKVVFQPVVGLDELLRSRRTAVRRRCADSHWEELARDVSHVLVEWRHDGCDRGEPEHELLRFIEGSQGRHEISLRSRGSQLPTEMRDQWIRILSEARLTYQEESEK